MNLDCPRRTNVDSDLGVGKGFANAFASIYPQLQREYRAIGLKVIFHELECRFLPLIRFQEQVRDQRALRLRTVPGTSPLPTIAPPISRPA